MWQLTRHSPQFPHSITGDSSQVSFECPFVPHLAHVSSVSQSLVQNPYHFTTASETCLIVVINLLNRPFSPRLESVFSVKWARHWITLLAHWTTVIKNPVFLAVAQVKTSVFNVQFSIPQQQLPWQLVHGVPIMSQLLPSSNPELLLRPEETTQLYVLQKTRP